MQYYQTFRNHDQSRKENIGLNLTVNQYSQQLTVFPCLYDVAVLIYLLIYNILFYGSDIYLIISLFIDLSVRLIQQTISYY